MVKSYEEIVVTLLHEILEELKNLNSGKTTTTNNHTVNVKPSQELVGKIEKLILKNERVKPLR